MRILHSSDWHLGRSFHGVGTLAAQREWLNGLVGFVQREKVEVVLVAGDVYDRALPAVDVVELLDETLARLVEAGAKVVISSGNHDSAVRLGFGSRLLEGSGVSLRTRVEEIPKAVTLPLDGGAELAIYGLPYLEPRLVAEELGVEPGGGHEPVVAAALARVREDLERRRQHRVVRSIVMAHVFAGGGSESDSERTLAVGGVEIVPAALFEEFDYAALGHLHGRQRLSETVRYSGSPLAYSFSEAFHEKGAWLLEVEAEGLARVEAVGWPGGHRLAVLRGPLEELLAAPEHEPAESAYCQVTLTDDERPAHAMERLRERFPLTVSLAFAPEQGGTGEGTSYSRRLAEAEDEAAVCAGFYRHVRGRSPDDAELAALAEAIERLRAKEALA